MSIFIRGTSNSKILFEKISDSDDQLLKELREQKDTRISDRIRRRSSHQLIQPDICDTLTNDEKRGMNLNKGCGERDSNNSRSKDMFSSIQQNIYACSCSKPSPVVQSPSCRCGTHRIPSARKPAVTNINNLKCFDTTDEEESFRKTKENQRGTRSKAVAPSFTPKKRVPVREIPTKPKVTLKSVKSPVRSGSTSQTSLQKKQSQSKFVASHVERIDRECLVISPEPRNNDEFLEKVRERDREAMIRGQKALEKERLQREYNEMMKKLPVLQKLERLYEMNEDKPEYHMTEDRLREQEKKKQSILDDTYEKLFPDRRPPPITIPVKNPSKSTVTDKEKIENSPSLNLGIWESGRKSKKLYTEEEVEAMLREGKSESKFKTDQLKSVLEKLRKQKEEILKEIQTQQLSETLPFSTSAKGDSKRVRNSSESSVSSDTSRKGKSEKKFVSVKVGTNSLQSSSSCDTVVEEPAAKKSKSTKRAARFESKSVQVAGIPKKPKSPTQKSQKRPKIVVKEQKTKEISSSSERSTADVKRSSSAESARSNQTKKLAEKDHSPSAPTNSLVSLDRDPSKTQSNQIKSCDCDKDAAKKSADLCEIVIKIKDGKSSEVKIKEGKKDKTETVLEKSSAKKPDKPKETKSNQRLNEVKKALNDDCCRSKDGSKPESWHDKFLKNNSQVSTSSTSYMSPPHLPNKPAEKPRVTPYFCDLIGKKPQQLNLNSIPPTTKKPREDLHILGEVQKVLAMSRQSIDELGVSSVSTVTTPSQSVIDLESNRLNTSTTGLSTSRAAESGPSNSRSTVPNFSFLSVSSENRTMVASEMDSNEPYPDVLAKYARIAEQCSQRISDLTSMIDKVRQDKNKMLQTSSLLVANDSSTKYMDLPSPNKSTRDSTKGQSSMSSSSSGDSKLLDINFSLAEKLRGMTPEEVKNFGNGVDRSDCVDNSKGEEELVKRFRALKETPSVINDKRGKEVETTTKTSKKDGSDDVTPPKQSNPEGNMDFVPLLLDIPKMPALAVDSSGAKHKKPPPSKSFMAARKFTDFIAPHELSTIPEQDSQMKLDSTLRDRSPKEQRRSEVAETVATPKKIAPLENKPLTQDNNVKRTKENNTAVSRSSSSPLISQSKNSSSKTKESLNNSDYSFGSSNTSGDEKVEMLRIEAMLRSIGMDWAISTLRKTQEALALTSSSSSIDVKSPSIMKNLSDSDIKEYLSKQMFQKISSSTLRTDASPGSLNESREFSDIRHSDFVYKQTSTPVNRSRELPKSHEKSSDLPSAIESDKISNDFFSLPEHSP
ncbi:muscle M-line assembly protein unc-89 isoform X2 [Coccinella septempunctata]|uniref:muscle M-line assembly protein unc-89 isoform X2 n=1 Tax=Coccinella septempunctata TaxID=41139 RepID=UPI001D07C31B|nr:muscle M-line assembly protein unc-89 isoform X2 [Coccinella septempunctata]